MNFITELKPNPENPRTITKDEFERLKAKIERNPDGLRVMSILYKDGVVIAGNQRFRALKELAKEGLKIEDSWFVDGKNWTQEQINEFIFISNISDGQWDWDSIANNPRWDEQKLADWGISTPTSWTSADPLSENSHDLSSSLNSSSEELRESLSVSIILDRATFVEFMTYVDYFKGKLGTENTTDTVVRAIKEAYEDSIR